MCLTPEAFALFLNLLGAGLLTTQSTGSVTIHASTGDVTWHSVVDEWCTAAPHTDARLPFLPAEGAQPFTLR